MQPGPSPILQFKDDSTTIFRTIRTLLSSESDISVRHMNSTIGIGRSYYQTLSDPIYGWRLALVLSVFINLNIGLLNLLPFPILDGGHIVMAVYEWIRKKPLNQKILAFVQMFCALLLIGFMVYVTFYDIGDLIREKDMPLIRW